MYEDGRCPGSTCCTCTTACGSTWPAAATAGKRGSFGQELFFASGEEKTHTILPKGYGYEYKATDPWLINYMLHNLLTTPDEVYIVYDIDFIPMSDPGAKAIKPAHPVWNDVQRGQIYPVFDVIKGDGGKDGVYTYPDDADNPYGEGPKKNEWVVPEDMTLVATGGHLHPGGIHTDMYVTRNGKKVRIFQSKAIYYEPAGAVSWDVSMTVTPADWMVRVKKGDVISISRHLRHQPGVLVRVDGDHGPLGDVRTRRGGSRPVHRRRRRRPRTT